jgi:hypothetical protein
VRVYLATTLPAVRDAATARALPAAAVAGFAVTPMVRELHLGELDELEDLAQRLAARQSLRLLAADPGAPPRRAVLAVEVSDGDVAGLDVAGPGTVLLRRAPPWTAVAAGMLDDAAAEPLVAAAAAAVSAADAGDEDAGWVVDAAEDAELAWFATQELADAG